MAVSPSHGVKRTASEAFGHPRRIRALHEDVVNKIAAGEIIVAPVHALKELIENAVDAGATALQITVNNGGLKALQITDNGCGINKDDLPILCERFTTSKLKTFEDLSSMTTYGFRGEALASISHIAHLTVTTKTPGSQLAYKAHYAGGKLVTPKFEPNGQPIGSAGSQGTTILVGLKPVPLICSDNNQVEDLFYNVPSRRNAFRSPSEEYAKIIDQVGRYAIHCKGVAFSCKKAKESASSLSIPAQADVIDRIRVVYNSAIANELFALKIKSDGFGFEAEGWVSSANYSGKKTTFLLFVNHRSVESTTFRRAIEQVYQPFLPRNGHPFVYVSVNVRPDYVDVNVHPTKREVRLLNDDEIIELICDEIRASLGKVDTSRTFTTQTLLSSRRPTQSGGEDQVMADAVSAPAIPGFQPPHPRTPQVRSTKPYENNLVRTDSRAQKITAMLPPVRPSSPTMTPRLNQPNELPGYTFSEKTAIICRLTSIKKLRADVRDRIHADLTQLISGHTFVGVVDYSKRIAAIQSGVKLLLIDYGLVSAEYFYQLGLTDFGNFGVIRPDPPLDLRAVLRAGAEQEAGSMRAAERTQQDEFDWEALVDKVYEQLIDRREMLAEYFSLLITEDGLVEGLPLMVKGYIPSMSKLPSFMLRLGPRVDWQDEQKCFDTFLRELAVWYVPEPLTNEENDADGTAGGSGDGGKRQRHLERAIEHVLFPAFKSRLVATKDLRKGVLEVADLKGLYRVFERC